MEEIDINKLVSVFDREIYNKYMLNEGSYENIIITGKIDNIYICHRYNKLNLSRVECNEIIYKNQLNDSIKNHIWVDFTPLSPTTKFIKKIILF